MITVYPVTGLPEITADTDLAGRIAGAVALRDGDIVVITSKVVSKAEGRVVAADRQEAIDAETVRVVARRGELQISETRHGLILAAAGVDSSNVETGKVVLLPTDPDASADALRSALRLRSGVDVAVVITDTLGRPWRRGLTDVAIGVAGMAPLADYRGRSDPYGNPLRSTEVAVADEVAAAADLVKGKLAGVPVAILRGLRTASGPGGDHVGGGAPGGGHDGRDSAGDVEAGARALIRPAAEDLFRLGSADVVPGRRTIREFTADPVDPAAVRRAVAAAITAPAPHHTIPWRFAAVEDPQRRVDLLDAMRAAWRADLIRDGLSPESVTRRLRRGEPLYRAPYLVVPCLLSDGAHPYPDPRRAHAEREMFLVAMGAGVENLLIALAVEGLGSCWVSSTMFCRDVVRAELALPAGWEPMGAVGVGHPLVPPTARPARDPDDVLIVR